MNSAQKYPETTDLNDLKQPTAKRILFVQLNRLGDIIQSAQIAKELKEQRPDLRIDIIARTAFASQLKEILQDCFDNVYHIGMDSFLKEESTLDSSFKKIQSLIHNINAEPVSILINQSFSKSSSILSSLINSNFRFGMYLNKHGEVTISDKWSQYIYSTVMTGNLNDLHLNDIFRLMIGIKLNPRNECSIKSDSNTIALSPFSSHVKKSWRLEKWTEIIYQVLKKNPSINIALIGSPREHEALLGVSQQPLLKSFSNRLRIHCQQSIYETYKLIQDSRLYLGHDSLCSNLASLANRKSIIVSLGTVRHQETFPDGVGNIILAPKTNCYPCFPNDSCSNFKCHADINYNLVSEVVIQVCDNGIVSMESLKNRLNEFQLSQSEIFESTQKENNLLTLNVLSDNKMDLSRFARGIYRVSWLYYFEEISETFGSDRTSYPDISILTSFQNAVEQLFDLFQHGTSFSKYILEEVAKDSPCIQTIKDMGKKIDEIDQLIVKVATITPPLNPICRIALLKKSQLEPGHLVHLTEQTFLIYNEGITLCRIVSELTRKAIERNQKTNRNNTMMVNI